MSKLVQGHRLIARLSVTSLCLALVIGTSQQGLTQAGPPVERSAAQSILPQSVGVGLPTNEPITIEFATPMDRASVAEGLQLLPTTSYWLAWTRGDEVLRIYPTRRWATDERYVVAVPAATEQRDGSPIGDVQRFTFTTQTAPAVIGFAIQNAAFEAPEIDPAVLAIIDPDVDAVAGTELQADDLGAVSARSKVTIRFSTRMSRAAVEEAFAITPHADGQLTWEDDALVFTPSEPLDPDARYTISLRGARDSVGNRIGGETSFTFTTTPGAQLVKVRPRAGERDVAGGPVELWFSQPMDSAAVEASFSLVETASSGEVAGAFVWNADYTQLRFEPTAELAAGSTFEITLAEGAIDLDGNPVEESYRFTTASAPTQATVPTQPSTRSAPGSAPAPANAPAPPAPAPAAPAAPPPGDVAAYALHQVNSARAAYGFAPLVLDPAISAVAAAHAADQLRYGYFSHTGRDGSSVHQRLARAGIGFSTASENQCQNSGKSVRATLDWCHGYFMAEPYPGHWNHIGNILNPRFTRMGIGIAEGGGKVLITWNFAG